MKLELQDTRILAALRGVDAIAKQPILYPLQFTGSGVQCSRNRRGDYLIRSAPGFERYSQQFQIPPLPPNTPTSRLIELQVNDPNGHYLPRRVRVQLPRDADPANFESELSLFQPIRIPLFPSPAIARLPSGWTVIYVTVLDGETQARLPWSWIRVTRATNPVIDTLAQADWRGEAVVIIPDIPVTLAATEADTPQMLVSTLAIEIEVIFDPIVQPLPSDADFVGFENPNESFLPDPDDLTRRSDELRSGTTELMIIAAHTQSAAIAVSLT